MNSILLFINEYAQLINFVLFTTLIGWIFSLTQTYAAAKDEKYLAQIASLEAKIDALIRERDAVAEKYQSQIVSNEAVIGTLRSRIEQENELHQATVSSLSGQLTLERERNKSELNNWDHEKRHLERVIEQLKFYHQMEKDLHLAQMANSPQSSEELQGIYQQEITLRMAELKKQEEAATGNERQAIQEEKNRLQWLSNAIGQMDPAVVKTAISLAAPLGIAYFSQRSSGTVAPSEPDESES